MRPARSPGPFAGPRHVAEDLQPGAASFKTHGLVIPAILEWQGNLVITSTPVTNLRVAVTQRIQHDGEWRDGQTNFFKVNVWRGQAEHLADSLAKGDRVMATGRLRLRTWETPEGDKRSVAEIEADEVGASLKFATAKVERASERSSSDRSHGRERQPERGGDFSDQPPF